MPTTDYWPFDFVEMKQNQKGQTVYTFAPQELTIKRVFLPKLDGSKMQYSTGWTFDEDETVSGDFTGVIWSHSGKWDNDVRAFVGPYAGRAGAEGDKVKATLSLVEADGRNFYNLQQIAIIGASLGATPSNAAPSAPDAAPSAPDAAPAAPTVTSAAIQVRIASGMAFNNLTAALVAGKTAPIQDAVKLLEAKWPVDPSVVWAEWMIAAAEGKELPLVFPVAEEPAVEEPDGSPDEPWSEDDLDA